MAGYCEGSSVTNFIPVGKTTKDSVQTITDYIKNRKVPEECKDLPADKNAAITELCVRLKNVMASTEMSAKEKARKEKNLITEIYLSVFFLLPHHTKRHAGKLFMKLHHGIFEDALQNMSINVLAAIRKFDPTREKKFSNYILMYLKDALYKSIKHCNVVTPKNFRKANMALLELPNDDQDCSEQPDLYSLTSSRIKMGVISSNKEFVYTENGSQYLVEMSYYDDAKDCVEALYEEEMRVWLRHAIDPKNKILTADEATIIKHHFNVFGCPKLRLKDLAEVRKKSGKGGAPTRVSQIEQSAIKKLRRYFKSVGLEYTPN